MLKLEDKNDLHQPYINSQVSKINKTVGVDDIDMHFELIKIIKRYEFCVGWTLLIAPDHLPKKDILVSCSVNLEKVLIVKRKHCNKVLDAAKRALKHDNCSAMVIWDDMISGTEVAELREQAQSVGTALYMLDNRASDITTTSPPNEKH